MNIVINQAVSAKDLANLRESVGWNRLEDLLEAALKNSYLHIACFNDEDKLIGFVDSVSNAVTDAYIQDLMVHPDYQGQGIGSRLVRQMISELTNRNIYMISRIYADEALISFYEKFGFPKMYCGKFKLLKAEFDRVKM